MAEITDKLNTFLSLSCTVECQGGSQRAETEFKVRFMTTLTGFKKKCLERRKAMI